MLTITFDKSKLKHRPLSALIRYLSEKYIQNVVTTDNTIFFTEQQVDILKKAALLENALVEDNYIFSYKDVFNKEQLFTKEDLLTFASNVKNQSLQICFGKKVKTNKLTKERLQFMYLDCVNKLYELANFKGTSWGNYEGRIARKINHYRQLLNKNRDIWDYLTVKEGLCSGEFSNWKLPFVFLLGTTIYLDPKLTIKELVQKAKPNKSVPWSTVKPPTSVPNIPERSTEWVLEQIRKHKENLSKVNQYKMTITDCHTGNVVQEFYLPKEV